MLKAILAKEYSNAILALLWMDVLKHYENAVSE